MTDLDSAIGAAGSVAGLDEAAARSLLDAAVSDFLAGAAEDEVTLAENEAAWRSARFRPRVLRDVSTVSTATSLLGVQLDLPVLAAPTGGHRLVHPEGEIGSAAGVDAAGAGFVASTASSIALEDVAAVAGSARWFQLYWFQDRSVTLDLVRRAIDAGYMGVVLTVDSPVLGLRRRDLRNRFDPGTRVRWANLDPYGASRLPAAADGSAIMRYFVEQIAPSVTFDDVALLAAECPVIVKGIIRGDDAQAAVAAGASAVYVSNHGGRQLDRTVPTRDALTDVVDAVAGEVPVVVDGGIRTGSDVVAALAVGAAAVGIGRPLLWALATGGTAGVAEHLRRLAADLRRTMALLGAATVADLSPDLVADARSHQ